jgi:hypothetical protein
LENKLALDTEDFLRALAQNAESICRHYLPAGKREGSYWMVGDLQNNPGRSLFVRLTGPTSGQGAAGRWTEYVAERVMLNWGFWVHDCGRLRQTAQHNVRPRWGFF